ncbi:MAG: PVC-type heme-binding CxxCH protein [Planctomycetales bacterium]
MRSLCTLLLVALVPLAVLAADESGRKERVDGPVGILPRGVDGQPLNLDFERGDLTDWRAEGEAFRKQPVKGDAVFARRNDMRSEHAGEFWVGTYENPDGDGPQGTLSSAPFKVTHPFAAFLIGGGSNDATRVELVRQETGRPFYKTSARNSENMHRVVVDLSAQLGKEIFIRLVDQSSDGWGHLNFDDFRLYESKPKFSGAAAQPADLLEFAGVSPAEAARAMTLPEGFRATAFAGEPDVMQPIAMTIDDRGRLWVAEAYAYPVRVPDDEARDRIVIFEDQDNDGQFDRRTVFAEKLNLVSGLEVGFGGVWVGAAPDLLFIPDRDGDDRPDGPPEVKLDGWAYEDTHETLNSFVWGPDGWLYGCHGVFTHSRVGKPGTPKQDRTPINAGIWRYHPVREEFEVFAWGTSNPWGVDFNDQGDCFLTCCVIPHLFHIIQGGRYQRQAGEHFQEFTYADIPTIAKHRHWIGNQWNEADRAKSDAQGGGHAHAGAMIYLGGTWPTAYRNQLFMNNIHGARLNLDLLEPAGSGYVGDGAPDFCKTNDLWSQILYLRSGPDGNVYLIDWYDKNQCHHRENDGHDRSNGRIFKISYGDAKPLAVNLQSLSDRELVEAQLSQNDWYVRQGRRILQERAVAKRLDRATRPALAMLAFRHADPTRRLRGLWGLHVTGGLSEAETLKVLSDDDPHVRGWGIQLALETEQPTDKLLDALMTMSRGDESPVVRRFIASGLQRIPLEQRWDILVGLLAQGADAQDHNLPLLYWYAAEPLAALDMHRAYELATGGNLPLVQELMFRRIAAIGTPEALGLLVSRLDQGDVETQRGILQGMRQSLRGRRQVPMPAGWMEAAKKLAQAEPEVRTLAFSLSVTFGDPVAQRRMRELLADGQQNPEQRLDYLATLLASRDPQLPETLRGLLDEPAVRGAALRGLAAYDDPATPAAILERFAEFSAAEKRDALATLSSRVGFARTLLDAIGDKRIAAVELSADGVRQLRNLKNEALDEQIVAVWGVLRDSPEDKARLIAEYTQRLRTDRASPEELPLGRAVFAKVCQQCHTLFGSGGKVGPELTGSNRGNLDYLLSNVLDPSAVMGKDYIPHVIETAAGRVITGLVKEETQNAVTVVTANETIVIPRDEIDSMVQGEKSMMPDDLLKALSEAEVRALVGYLAAPRQVPMQATLDNVATFFNGKDLDGWQGNPELWRVENGEIVGTSQGLRRNEFLSNHLLLGDFRLSLEVKLTPDAGNSGIQFRSEKLPEGEVKGYQADIGAGWWGKLYEEHGRALLWNESGEEHVRQEEWNRYEIVARGSRIQTFINGQRCVDLEDDAGARQGIIALQLHSGGPFEVRFRRMELRLEP